MRSSSTTMVGCPAPPAGVPTAHRSALPAGSRAPACGSGWRNRRSVSPVQDALPDRTAEISAAGDAVDDHERDQDEGGHAFEFEPFGGQAAGQGADRIAAPEKRRHEIE